MNAQTVRTALGTIQSNSGAEDAWLALSEALKEGGGDLASPDALSLLQAARSRHAQRGESDAVARLLELSITLCEEDVEQAALWSELSSVVLDELFDGSRAIEAMRKAVSLSATDAKLASRLEELEARQAGAEEQAQNYLKEAESASDDDYRSAMLMRASEVEVCFFAEPSFSKVVENLEKSVRLDSQNAPTLRLLECIYRKQSDWEGLTKVLSRAADRASDPAARASAGVRLARLYQYHFSDEEKAAAAYDKVLENDQLRADGMEFVTDYYSKNERWDDLVRVYEKSLSREPSGVANDEEGPMSDPQRLGDLLQVAMLQWKKRGSSIDAEPWFAKIQILDPTHDGVLNFYRQYKEELNDDAGLVQILQAARDALPEDDDRRDALELEIASKQDDQAGAQRLIEQYKSALRANPEDDEAREKLKVLYKQTQGHNALVELMRQDLERTSEENYDRRLAIMREIAGVYRQYVKSDTALVGLLNQIVNLDGKLDENDVGEVRELVSLYEKLSRPRDHLSSLKILAEIIPDPEEKIAIYRQVGRRWLDQFSNVQHAMVAFAALHELDPTDPEAIERLEDLYRKRRAWKDLFAIYEHQLSRAEGIARVPHLREMAQLAAERLSKINDALGFFNEILQIDPSRVEVLDPMEKYAERSKNWEALAEVLEQRLAHMNEDQSRLPVLQKLGTVYGEHLGKHEDAIGTWRRVVSVQPAHPRAMRVLRDSYLKASRFDELEDLYREQNELESLAEVLSTAADRNKNAEEKLDLSYRAARVYEEELGQPARAIRSYERILSIEEKDERAIAHLLPLYEREEKWARIPPLLEVQLELADDDEARVQIYSLLIQVSSGKLGDKKGAVVYARRAFEMAPDDPRALELLDEAARSAGAWEEAVEVLSARLENLGGLTEPKDQAGEPAPKPKKRRKRKGKKNSVAPQSTEETKESIPAPAELDPRRRPISLRLARILGEELGRVEEAMVRLKALANRAPKDEGILNVLERLVRLESRPEDLRWLFEHRQAQAESSDQRVGILVEWALYEEGVVSDLEAALHCYERAHEIQPENMDILEAIVRLSLPLGKATLAAKALAEHRDLLDGVDAAQKDAMLAELYAERLNKPEESLQAARRALEGGAERGVVIPVLQILVRLPSVRAEAARTLSEQYEAGGDSRQEADAVRALISETIDEPEQIELYKKLSLIYEEKLNEPGAALTVMIDALSLHPQEIELWDSGAALATASGRPTELSDAYRSALRGKLSDDLALELSRRAAQLHENALGDPQGAAFYYELILSLDSDDSEAFIRLKEILTAGERWRELDALYEKEIQRQDDEERRVEMLAEAALLAEDIVGDLERATGYHLRILEIDPEKDISLESLDRIYTRLDKKPELHELLEKRATLTLGEDQHRHLVRIAQLSLALHKPDKALKAIEDVLAEDPGNYESRDIAEELLLIGSVRVRAALALELVYEAKDEFRDLVRVLGIRVDALRPREDEELEEAEVSRRDEERRDLLRRVATLRDDRLHDDEGSFDVFAELAPLDPMDADLRERLIDSGRRLGRSATVVEVLLSAADLAEGTELKAEVLLQAAGVQRDQLNDVEGAEESLKKVLALGDDEPQAALAAARIFESILVDGERHQELAQNLKYQVELEDDFERKAELLARLAHLSSDVLKDVDAAIWAWEARLSDNSEDPEALRNLSELYEKSERYEDMVRVLSQRRESTTDVQDRASLFRHLADVQEHHLDETSDAIESYQAILDESGATVEVLAALTRLYEKAERWEELAEIYERQSDISEDEVERLGALACLGRLRAERLDDVPGALDTYRRALAVDMNHPSSREALNLLLKHEDPQARLEAAEILHPIYEAEGKNESLLDVIEAQVNASDDPAFCAARYREAVRIAEDSLNDPQRAFAFSLRATRVAVGQGELDIWLEILERLAKTTSARDEQVKLLVEIVPDIFDADAQLSVQKRIGEILRTELSDSTGAIEAYRQALNFAADDQDALIALEELYEEAGDWPQLLATLEQRTEITEDDSVRKSLRFRRAKLLATELDDSEGALAMYEQIVEVDLDIRAVEALEALYTKGERFDDLAALIQRRIDEAEGSTADLQVELASVCAEKQDDVQRGLDILEQALAENSQHEGAVTLLERLALSTSDVQLKGRAASLLEPVYMVRADFDQVLRALNLRLAGSDAPDERRELVARIAQIQEEQKEDYGAALEITSLLLQDDLNDVASLEEMERLANVAGEELRLANLLFGLVKDMSDDDEGSARICRRAGEIFAQNERFQDALLLLRRALDFEPENNEVFVLVDDLLTRVGTAEDRVALHRQVIDHRYEPEEQVRLLQVIAQLEEQKLGNEDAAIDAHRQATEVDEDNELSLDALVRLYRRKERWDELVELYQKRAESGGPVDGAVYRLALADLYVRKLGQHEPALDQLEEIVRDLPNHKEAIERLEAMRASEELRLRVADILRPIYQGQDDWRRLIQLNEDRYSLADDPMDRVTILRETADLWESRGDEPLRARRVLVEAWRLTPDDDDVRGELERLSGILNEYQSLADLYEEILDKNPDLMMKREVVARLAVLYDEVLDSPRQALMRYEDLGLMDESDPEAIEASLRISLLLGDWKTRESALLRKVDSLYDELERAEVYARLGALRALTLGDSQGAIQAYERAYEADDNDTVVCDRLIELYEEKKDSSRLVELYIARAEGEHVKENLQFSLLVRAARTFEEALLEVSRAIECYVQALAVRPGDREIIVELNRLYRKEELWGDLLDNLRLEAGTAETAEQRIQTRFEIAEILAEHMNSPDEALESYGAILDEKPDAEKAIKAIFGLVDSEEHLAHQAAEMLVPALRQTQLYEYLVRALKLRLSEEHEPHQRVETLRSMAQVQEDELKDHPGAFESYLSALADAPEVVEIYDRVERLADGVKGWSRFAEVLRERAAETFESDLACSLWVRLARIYEEHLGQKAEAIEAYQAAADQVGDREELLDALDRLYTDLDDTPAVVELLERRMALADSDVSHSRLLCRQGQLYLDKEKRPAEALSSFRQALERDVANEEASSLLARLLDDDDLFEEAFDILDGVYRDRKAGEALAGLHGLRVKRAQSADERLDMRRSLALVLEEECGDALAAQRVLQEGLVDDLHNEGLRDEIERLLPITDAWGEGALALLTALDADPDIAPDVGREICERAAGWQRDRAGDGAAAEKSLQRALVFDPEGDEILEQLESLQSVEGREESLLGTLRKRAVLAPDEGTKVELLRRCFELASGLGQHAVVEEVLREILDSDEDDELALKELTSIRRLAGDDEEVFELLGRRIRIEMDADKLRALRIESAALAGEKLDRVDDAVALLEELFEDDRNDQKIVTALRTLYLKSGAYEKLGELMQELVMNADEPTEKANMLVDLATLRHKRFDNVDEAIELLKDALVGEPSHMAANQFLCELYEQSSRFEELAELLDTRANSVFDSGGDEAVALGYLRSAAEVFEKNLADKEGALSIWLKINERGNDLDSLEKIYELQCSAGAEHEAAESLERICSLVGDDKRAERRNELVELYRRLEDVDAVIRVVEGSVELDPGNDSLRLALRKEYENAGQWQKVASLILKQVEGSEATSSKVELLREAAEIHQLKCDDPQTAAELLARASELAPSDRGLMLVLCDAYSGSGRGTETIAILEKVVESYGGKRSKELGEVHRRLATACLSEGDDARAFTELERAFRIEPGNVHVLKQLGELALKTGNLKKAQQMFRALLLQRLDEKSPITKAEVFCRLGQVHHALDELPKAKQMFERALQTDPSLEEAKAGLASL